MTNKPKDANKAIEPSAETLAVTVRRASQLLGIGPTKIYEMIAAGAIDSFKIGNRRLLKYESLKRLVAKVA